VVALVFVVIFAVAAVVEVVEAVVVIGSGCLEVVAGSGSLEVVVGSGSLEVVVVGSGSGSLEVVVVVVVAFAFVAFVAFVAFAFGAVVAESKTAASAQESNLLKIVDQAPKWGAAVATATAVSGSAPDLPDAFLRQKWKRRYSLLIS
jgi:hypothetical protein